MTDHPATPPSISASPGPLPPPRLRDASLSARAPRSARRKRLTAIGVIGAIMLGIAGWSAIQATRPAAGSDRFLTVVVDRGSVAQRLNSSGTVTPVNEMATRFPASGTVLEVRAAVGDTVSAGDVLAVLDDAALRRTLLQAQADADAAAHSLAELKEAQRAASQAPSAPSGTGGGQPGTGTGGGTTSGGTTGAGTGGGGTSGGETGGGDPGGTPAPALPPLPEIALDPTPVETALAGSDAALALVVERQADADAALAAMTEACAVPASGSASTKPARTRTAKPEPSATSTATAASHEGRGHRHDKAPDQDDDTGPSPAPPSATPSPSASKPAGPGDQAACQAALTKAATAQTSLAQAQAQLSTANAQGLDALRAAQAAVMQAVQDLGAWLTAVAGVGGSPQQPGTPQEPGAPQQPSTPQEPAPQPPAVDAPVERPTGGEAGPGRSSLASAEVALAKAKRALAAARDDVDAATMRAPMSGMVTELPFTVGATASEADRAVITGAGAVSVTIHVPASVFLYVSPGQQATVRAPGGGEAKARVASKTLVPDDKGFPVTVVTQGADTSGFSAGMTASVSIDVSSASDVLIAPLSAVTRPGGSDAQQTQATARVLRGTEPEEVPVHLGSIGDTHAEIVSGLQEGDRLVIADATLPLPGLDMGG